jgi:hypothetical protein
MKTFKIILVTLILLSFAFNTNKTVVKITSKSELTIKGSSNVNNFECKYNNKLIEDEIQITSKRSSNKLSLEGAKIAIKSKGFDCVNKMITKDFKTLLKANEYENINLELKEILFLKEEFNTKINVEIAGVKRDYILPVIYDEKNEMVKGNLVINIEDFNLKTPKKLLGFIVVKDKVTIKFNLHLQY